MYNSEKLSYSESLTEQSSINRTISEQSNLNHVVTINITATFHPLPICHELYNTQYYTIDYAKVETVKHTVNQK